MNKKIKKDLNQKIFVKKVSTEDFGAAGIGSILDTACFLDFFRFFFPMNS